MADPLETRLCYHPKFGNSRSKHTNVTIEILQKKLTPHVPPLKVTQASSSLKPTRINWLPMTSY